MNRRSEIKLKKCHQDLQDLFFCVDKYFPFKIVETYRGPAKQLWLYKLGKTKVKKSKHNIRPPEAIDVYPEPIRWYDTKRMYYFAGMVMGIAKSKKISIRWGGDWDRDTEVMDNTFNDLGHFELGDKDVESV